MPVDVITGAFGYSGAAIARELQTAGREVRTLTGHPREAAGGIDTRPLDFADPDALARDLSGVHTMYCTYWVRFAHGSSTRQSAVANSKTLLDAAARAGVERIVYVSILHADPASPYPYFSGKGEVERHLAGLGVPYAVARPSILFGSSAARGVNASVLLNNIAWLLRHLPAFGVGDGGGYRIRPIHVDDLARLCVGLGGQSGTVTVDAVGPDAPTFKEVVTAIRAATGSRSLLAPVPGWLIPPLATVLGAALRDVLLTAEEYGAMRDGLATSDAPAAGPASLLDWIAANGADLGRSYANELDRHYRPGRAPHS
jgi:NADH dehydrogenase